MIRGLKISAALALVLLSATAVLSMASGIPLQDELPDWAESCASGGQKWVDPSNVMFGEGTKVTMVMTATCAPYVLPVDIVFVVDRSNSMTKGSASNATANVPGPGTPNVPPGTPNAPGDPTKFPTQEKPDPTQKPVPPAPTALGREARAGVRLVRGLAQAPILSPVPPGGTPSPRKTPSPVPGETSKPRPTTNAPGPTSNAPRPTTNVPIPGPTSNLIVRDREEPAGTEDLLPEVRDAIYAFLDYYAAEADAGRMRFGLVTFNDRARVDVDLNRSNNGASQVRSRLARLDGQGNTRIDLGLSAATRVLFGISSYRGRTDYDHTKIVILFSDGKADPRTTARLRRRDDATYFSVAVGREADRRTMNDLASERQFALEIRDRKELAERVGAIKPNVRDVTLHTLSVEEKLLDNMELVPGSANPAVSRTLADGTLAWDLTDPTLPLTFTYEVKPQEMGLLPVAETSRATWKDSEDRDGITDFPDVQVDVGAVPTDEPSPPTPEPTNTEVLPTETPQRPPPQPMDVYLPWVGNDATSCQPTVQTVDIALVVDTSKSMSDATQSGGVPKIEAAIAAGQRLVSLLKSGDQAAVISFNENATVLAGLTSDTAALQAAMRNLLTVQSQGTQIDKGLSAAVDEVTGAGHLSGNNTAIILVTDGRQDGTGPEPVLAAASRARSAGITIWAVAVGEDADQALLQQVATRPDTFVYAPNAEDLQLIYEDIARLIPCP